MPVKIYPFPVIHRQTLFAPGEALSAMGIERDQEQLPNSTLVIQPLMPVWNRFILYHSIQKP